MEEQLNKAMEQSNLKVGEQVLGKDIKFNLDNGKMTLTAANGLDGFKIGSGTALKGLGFDGEVGDGLSLDEFNNGLKEVKDSYLGHGTALDGMTGKQEGYRAGYAG